MALVSDSEEDPDEDEGDEDDDEEDEEDDIAFPPDTFRFLAGTDGEARWELDFIFLLFLLLEWLVLC